MTLLLALSNVLGNTVRVFGHYGIVHHNVTAHPSAEWTLQQFREALPGEHGYEYVIQDRDRIYSSELDRAVHEMGVRVLRTPVRAPRANCFCERVVRTIRRECLDFIITLSENTFGARSKSGFPITTTAAHIGAWGQVFPRRWCPFRRQTRTAINFLIIAA